MDLKKIIDQATKSAYGLKKLNFVLGRGIPFNRPHRIKINRLADHAIETTIPYIRKNLNHIRGIHACALATCSEFSSGFILLSNLNPKDYRLIMEHMEMTYHYQAKTDCISKTELPAEWFTEHIIQPLTVEDKVSVKNTVDTYDKAGNHICTAVITWQIKAWKKVKTKL